MGGASAMPCLRCASLTAGAAALGADITAIGARMAAHRATASPITLGVFTFILSCLEFLGRDLGVVIFAHISAAMSRGSSCPAKRAELWRHSKHLARASPLRG